MILLVYISLLFYSQGEGYLLVLVFDFDRNTVDDFVEAVIVRIEPPSLGRYTDVEEFEGYFDYGMLRLRYRVDCDNNFFGEGVYTLSRNFISMNS